MPTTLRDQLQQALGDAYVLERELAPGGMSRLFLATERSLDRRVVIKLLAPELASAVSAARFQREITLTAHLHHPHILPVLAAGAKNGLLYYVMPYAAGESLRERLAREGQLAVADGVQILRELADALDYAHRQGVVHRDLKPENVLLVEGHPVLADFGVARALEHATQTTGGERLTGTGIGLGTPGYMAPEQLAGDPTGDARSDIYALGVVGYEMLGGRAPFTAATPQGVAAAHFTEAPKPLTQLRSDVPQAVSAAITTALSKAPEERFATAADLRDALAQSVVGPRRHATLTARWAIVAAAGIALAVGGIVWLRAHTGGGAASVSGSIRLAVLPFENLGRPEDEYFADGMTEELTSRLASLSGLGVISRTSANQFRKTTKPLKQIGKELGVDYVLEGSVRWERSGTQLGRVRVTPQLIRVSDDSHVWADRLDADLTDVFQVQGTIAERVADALDVALRGSERPILAARPTANPRAYDLYLRGRYFFEKRGAANLAKALDLFRQAVATDPDFGRAYSGIGDCLMLLRVYTAAASAEGLGAADQAARRAVALDSMSGEAYTTLAGVLRAEEDLAGSERAYRHAITLEPNYAPALSWFGELLYHEGRVREAAEFKARAVRVEPLSPIFAATAAYTFALAGRMGEAIAQGKRAIELDSSVAIVHSILGSVYALAGRRGDALRELDTALRLDSTSNASDIRYGTAGYLYATAGERSRAEALLRTVERRQLRGRMGWSAAAMVHAGLGDTARALTDLEHALAEDDLFFGLHSLAEPWLDPLRGTRRFAAIVKTLGLDWSILTRPRGGRPL